MFTKYYIKSFVIRKKTKRSVEICTAMSQSVGYIFESMDDMERYIALMNARVNSDSMLQLDGAHFGFSKKGVDGEWVIDFYKEDCPASGSFASLVIGEVKGMMYVSPFTDRISCHPFLTQIKTKGGGNG